ncbi:MAG TPA: aromatic ring-hydroxylating dioxygenase subunit alpha [Fimbriimonadaceae bacterium]|nr:aromatic ring-hydroxylating dioxygenase subunit alpha [Fimbriimonadaceae bacterium]
MDLGVNPRIEEASTLPAAFYKDAGMFARCREEVFARSWQFVGDTGAVKVPGSVYPFTLLEGCLDEPMVLTRDMDDRLHLLSNVCTHRGMAVVDGAGNERFLRCRYHGRRFGLDGKFQSMPEFEEVCDFPSPKDDLARPPLGQWGPLLFASVCPTTPFDEVFGPMVDRVGWLPLDEFVFDPAGARDYVVRANWALYVDNYSEGFHIPFIHAALNEALDYESYTCEQYAWSNLQLAVGKDGEACFDLPKSSPDYGKRISAYYYWVFPNTMFNFYPWGLSINVVRPLAADLTKVSFLPYVWDASKRGAGAGSALDRVEREDEVVVELVQKGVRSRFYDRGRFSPKREQNVHHFHRLLSAALGG